MGLWGLGECGSHRQLDNSRYRSLFQKKLAECEAFPPEKREMEQIDVEMKNVEFLRTLADVIDHKHRVREDVGHRGIKAKRTSTAWSQHGA